MIESCKIMFMGEGTSYSRVPTDTFAIRRSLSFSQNARCHRQTDG